MHLIYLKSKHFVHFFSAEELLLLPLSSAPQTGAVSLDIRLHLIFSTFFGFGEVVSFVLHKQNIGLLDWRQFAAECNHNHYCN